jgi:hypothetical protein
MGTSSSYKGPTGTGSLLPPWADAPPEPPAPPPPPAAPGGDQPPPEGGAEGQPAPPVAPQPRVSWRAPKATMTRFARGASPSLRSTFRSYVGAHRGGSRGAAHAAVAGRRATGRVLGFFADAARNGFVEAARRIGLRDFVGRDVQSVLAALIDLLAPEGALLEEAAARAAVIETMTELFDALDVEMTGMDALDHLSETDLAKAFELSICNVIEARFTQELAHRVERSAMDEAEANRTLSEIRDHIRGIVALDLEGVSLLDVDWGGTEGATFIETWLSAAYGVLEEGE